MKKDGIKAYTGKDDKKAYVIFRDKVYDVTESKLWKNGVHMARHKAGEDLTDFIGMAPHGDEVFNDFKEIDIVEKDKDDQLLDRKETLRDLYRKFHPHPILIHYPLGLYLFSGLMQFLFLMTKNSSFENSAFYSVIFASVANLPAVLSGLFSWWVNYDRTITSIFKNKILFSIILLFLGVIIVALRFSYSDMPVRSDLIFSMYNILLFLTVPVVSIIGYYGGKITWPS